MHWHCHPYRHLHCPGAGLWQHKDIGMKMVFGWSAASAHDAWRPCSTARAEHVQHKFLGSRPVLLLDSTNAMRVSGQADLEAAMLPFGAHSECNFEADKCLRVPAVNLGMSSILLTVKDAQGGNNLQLEAGGYTAPNAA